ncbi:hypothetical protein DPMN_185546 [Dreissena polymorpha]|uniref:Uncharacterized protein n=1 Tax=Dreissena polymorpha TaxID=45954 RepID=A0A9D4DM39_DREPO|nr:hypothetical protein DPMN_185546 [Dreissena polymorpha]
MNGVHLTSIKGLRSALLIGANFQGEICNIPGGHVFQQTVTIFELSFAIIRTNLRTNHVFQRTGTIFKFSRAIIRTNLWTKFHEDRTINVISRVLTRKTSPPPGGHISYILTRFHEHWTKNVTPRVLTSFFNYVNIRKITPPPGGHVFLPIRTIIKLNRCIQEANVLTKFHEDWTKNVTSRVFRLFTSKTAPPPGDHVFQRTGTIF